jgi:micrococcal nuclease
VRSVSLGFVLLLLLSLILDRAGVFGYRGDDGARFDRHEALVTRVVDGDTIHIRTSEGVEATVRLIGVDAPEMNSHNNRPPDHYAEQATKYARARLDGKTIRLRLDDPQTRDRYGRLLAYVYLNESDNFNLDLIHDGEAYAYRRYPHTFSAQFETAENEARKKRRGLWNDVTESQMPEWRRKWLAELRAERANDLQGFAPVGKHD